MACTMFTGGTNRIIIKDTTNNESFLVALDQLLLHELSVSRSTIKYNRSDKHNRNNNDYNNNKDRNNNNRHNKKSKHNNIRHNIMLNQSKWINLYRLMDIMTVLLTHMSLGH
uniref:SET and MYND domain-containing protein DDB_G0273591-like n=1 Tax=Cicer arietinum TaxID=3827 RepID=A0A1S2Z7T2_CICAR|nr:SET and MYND domain-containing protein DDB_G0273591-like [Cicer arietinum]